MLIPWTNEVASRKTSRQQKWTLSIASTSITLCTWSERRDKKILRKRRKKKRKKEDFKKKIMKIKYKRKIKLFWIEILQIWRVSWQKYIIDIDMRLKCLYRAYISPMKKICLKWLGILNKDRFKLGLRTNY